MSARKLQEKGGGEVGVGLLRESSSEYDTFLLDVVMEANSPPVTYTILRQADKVRVSVYSVVALGFLGVGLCPLLYT